MRLCGGIASCLVILALALSPVPVLAAETAAQAAMQQPAGAKSVAKKTTAKKAIVKKAAAKPAKIKAPAKAAKQPKRPTYATLVIDADTGQVLQEENADARTYPASLTKMMTLYLLFEALERHELQMDTPLKVSRHASVQAPTKLGLAPGKTISVENAINAIITNSANDVAVVVGERLGGTESHFSALMTNKARALGMDTTTFRNASGLPNSGQITTAREMAILGKRLMTDFPQYYRLFSQREYAYGGRVYKSHNQLMMNYAGADGIKTGYTNASGFNLVTSAQRDGRRLIGVVLGGRTAEVRDLQLASLLDASFATLSGRPQTAVAVNEERQTEVAAQLAQADTALSRPTSAGDVDTGGLSFGISKAAAAEVPSAARLLHSWGIQIGAYGNKAAAEKEAAIASSKVEASFTGVAPRVETIKSGGRTLYRAQVMGLDEGEIMRACGLIKSKTKIGCQKLAPLSTR